MKNLLFTAFCLFLSTMASAQIGKQINSGKTGIAGTWINSQFGYEMKLVLEPDSSGSFDDEKLRYSLSGNKLTIISNGESTAYQYVIENDALILSGGDLDASVTFTRRASVLQPSQDPKRMSGTHPDNPSGAASSLIGTWTGQGERIRFHADGSCDYQGNLMQYTVQSNQITFVGQGGSASAQFTLSGNQLMLSGNGSTIQLQRLSTESEQSRNASPGAAAGSSDPSIAGKWCYVSSLTTQNASSSYSRCIVIHANGTYEYSAEGSISGYGGDYYGGSSSQQFDRGTWKLAGNQIYVQSEKEGSKVYSFEKRNHPKNNDPMIVIDGDMYVTYYQKAPW